MRTWILAMAAGAALGMSAPDAGQAQVSSTRARTDQKTTEREDARRDAEREKLRANRTSSPQADRERIELERARAEQVRRAADTRARTVQDTRARAEAAARDRERERLRQEREAYDARYGRNDDRYDNRRNNDDYDDRYNRDSRDTRWRDSNAPSFCRSGAGHPQHGRQWCRDKGFQLGQDQWGRESWGDIFVGGSRDRRMDRYNQNFGRYDLAQLLGSVVLNRFESFGRQYSGGTTSGRWLLDGGASVLQLYMGDVPIARLVDQNRDGRVDNVYLRN